MCSKTPTSGCHPVDVLPWLTIEPPAPIFQYSNIPDEIGHRWMLHTEEWFKKQNMLLDKHEFDNLSRSAVIFIDKKLFNPNILFNEIIVVKNKELNEFKTQDTADQFNAIPGFATDDVKLAKFPSKKLDDGLVHHPNVYRLI